MLLSSVPKNLLAYHTNNFKRKAGSPDIIPSIIKLRVPPVPRLWGPGMEDSHFTAVVFTIEVSLLCIKGEGLAIARVDALSAVRLLPGPQRRGTGGTQFLGRVRCGTPVLGCATRRSRRLCGRSR